MSENGSGLDLGISAWLEVGNKMSSQIGGLTRAIERADNYIERPIFGQFQATASNGPPWRVQTNPQFSPAPGKVWHVVRLALVANDDHTTLANAVASIYVGPHDMAQPGEMPSLVEAAKPIPFTNTYSKDRIIMNHNDGIFAFVYGASAPFTLILGGRILEFDIWQREKMSIR